MFGRTGRKWEPRGPDSIYGCWLAANLLGQHDRIAQYGSELRDRIPSGGAEQVSVAEGVFRELAAREFSPEQDVRQIADFVDDFLQMLGEQNRVERLKVEALIRSALGETAVFVDDIGLGDRTKVYMGVSLAIIRRHGIADAEVIDLVIDAEQGAKAEGVRLIPAERRL